MSQSVKNEKIQQPKTARLRPSSAAANIQSHPSLNTTSLYDSKRTIGATESSEKDAFRQRPVTHAGGSRSQKLKDRPKSPRAVESRRMRTKYGSLTQIDIYKSERALNIGDTEESIVKRLEKIEEKIDLNILEDLKDAFNEADADGSGKLDIQEFMTLLRDKLSAAHARNETSNGGTRPRGWELIQTELILNLFARIDWSSNGEISWDEFCTYMQLEYEEKEDSYSKAREVAFALPAKVENTPHREIVIRISSNSEGTFIAGSADGTLSFWSAGLELKKTRSVITPEQSQRTKPKWITDFMVMNEYTKIIVSTGDREIEFFELSSFEPYCRINGLETVPLKLDYSVQRDNINECLLLWGDQNGCVNILVLHATGECLRTWKKFPRSEGIACVGMEVVISTPSVDFIRWKVHDDWVLDIKYYESIRQVISCSNHDNSALVIGCTIGSTHVEQQLKEIKDTGSSIGEKPTRSVRAGPLLASTQPKTRLDADQTVFKVYKGVQAFGMSKSKNILVTGGMDRIIRIWNPYVNTKPTGMLRGHNSPIFYLYIAEEESRLFSVSTDKCIKVWDIHDQNCLLTVRPKGHKIRGDLQSCHYSPISRALMVATDQMSMLNVRLKPVGENLISSIALKQEWEESHRDWNYFGGHLFAAVQAAKLKQPPVLHADIVLTHKDPVMCCIYNSSFKHVITCSENSTIKVWDMESGVAIFEFTEAHDDQAVTCVTFDSTKRRLITGSRDGVLKIWNYNNGHCLRELRKAPYFSWASIEEDEDASNCEVTSVQYVEMSRNRFIVAVGWDRRINVFVDTVADSVHHVQYPLPKWPDDLANGHREDILSLAVCSPNLLATSSYDGEIIVWNMISGHVFCRLHAPEPKGYVDESLDGDLSINKLLFLSKRAEGKAKTKEAAILIASGPRGLLHFWSVYRGGRLRAQFPAFNEPGHMVSSMSVSQNNDVLMTGDNYGFISAWEITDYATTTDESCPPELRARWRGHTQLITCLDVVDENKAVVSGSQDCTVRVWTFEGHFIGTFGQPDSWNVNDCTTFQHPMVPYDVLVDPKSLPRHPTIDKKYEVAKVVHDDSREASDEEKETSNQFVYYQRPQFQVDDDTIAKQIAQRPYSTGTGKRLRHERMKPKKIDRGGPSEYQMLQCYNLEATPAIDEPNVVKNKRTDPFFFLD